VLYPYLHDSTWLFDDERTGLKQEAFVCGATEAMSRLVASKNIRNAENGFKLTFSETPFDGQDAELKWFRSDDSQVLPGQDGSAIQVAGNWYTGIVDGERMELWLCKALGLYFHCAPPKIYARAEPLPAGVDPIWQMPHGQQERRFVSAKPK
jgi:hypothetical protein